MAEEGTVVVLKSGASKAAEDCSKTKEMIASVDLPQDYSLSSIDVASVATVTSSNVSGAKPVLTGEHAWVSPNKSDEGPSSEESSPSYDDLNINENTFVQSGGDSNLNDKYGDFETTESFADSDPDLTLIGQRLDAQNLNGFTITEAVLDVIGKKIVKVTYGEKAVMMILPSEGYKLGSNVDFAEALAASLGITDKIVGLKTSSLVYTRQSSVFKYHGECILPFSALVSGEIAKMIDNSDLLEGVPSFTLITSSHDSYHNGNYQLDSVESTEALLSEEESSFGSLKEDSSYTQVFLKLMEESEIFNPFEKNALLKFGIDHAENGNILFRAAFQATLFTGNMSYFIRGLKAIANILLGTKATPEIDVNDNYITTCPKNESMSIFGILDFVISAEELYDSNDLTAQEYVTLLDAIIMGHASVLALFDLYHNPDFLLACDSDEDIQSSLCLRDLYHLRKKLEPLQPQSETGDSLLKWAIKTGIQNFSAEFPEVTQEFINIIFHMFSSGDEMVLAACEKFVVTGDTEFVVEVLIREWNIYCRNNTSREEGANASPRELQIGPSPCSDVPDCLLTAIACLVDEGDLANDKAVALVASYLKGNQLLNEIYDHFIEFGDVDDFLMMLKVLVSTGMDHDDNSRSNTFVSAADGSESSRKIENDFWPVLDQMKRDNQVGQVQIAALRLATAMKDCKLTQTLSDFRNNKIDAESFKRSILDVADRVIDDTC